LRTGDRAAKSPTANAALHRRGTLVEFIVDGLRGGQASPLGLVAHVVA